jgi:hypothetical protein
MSVPQTFVACPRARRNAHFDEIAYVGLALAEQSRAQRALKLDAPANLTVKAKRAYAGAKEALWAASSGLLLETTQAAASFTHALEPVRELALQTDALLDRHRRALEEKLRQIDAQPQGTERYRRAIALVQGTAPEVLESLPVARQTDLLERIRESAVYQLTPRGRFEEAQAKLYRAIQLDLSFLRAEETARGNVIATLLQHHRAQLLDARDRWSAWDEAQRLDTLTLIAHVHADVMGFPRPADVKFFAAAGASNAGWAPNERMILIEKNAPMFDDFECMLDTVFHANSHNWQDALAAAVECGQEHTLRHELRTQARLFRLNSGYYNSGLDARVERRAYEQQPTERHAFYTGRRFARALLRALESKGDSMSLSEALSGNSASRGIVDIAQVYEDAEDEPSHDVEGRLIGTVEIDGDGHLVVVQVEASRGSFLQRVVQRMNAKSAVSLVSTVPAAQPFMTRSVSVGREEPGFIEALRLYLQTYYGIVLG